MERLPGGGFGFFGISISNRTVTRNKRVNASVLAAFTVFSIYSAASMYTFQDRKLALWEYVKAEATVDDEGCNRNSEQYFERIKPSSPGSKVFTQLVFGGFVLAALYYIPVIRRDEEANG